MTHAKSQEIHTRKRFYQHFGIWMSKSAYDGLVRQIQNHQSLYVAKINKRKTNHLVEFCGRLFLVGYDKKTKAIATVLPTRTLEEVYA